MRSPEPHPDAQLEPPVQPRRITGVFWAGMYALIAREMKRFFNNTTYHLFAKLVVAMLFVVVFKYALPREGEAGAIVGLDFIIPGLILYALMNTSAEGPSLSIMIDKMERAISDVLMPPLGALEHTLGYIISGTLRGLGTGAFVCTGLIIVWQVEVLSLPIILLFAILTATMIASLSLLAGLLADKWDHYNAFYTFMFMPLTFLSGMFAPLDAYAPAIQPIIRLSPFYYAFDGFRAGFLGVSENSLFACAAVLFVVTLLLASCCYMVFKTGYRIKT